MAAEFGRVGHIQFDRSFGTCRRPGVPASVEMHSRGDGLTRGAIDDFDGQLAVGMRRCDSWSKCCQATGGEGATDESDANNHVSLRSLRLCVKLYLPV